MMRARTPKLTNNGPSFSSVNNERGDDAIVLVLGVIVVIALLWVAGGDPSHDLFGRSDAPDAQTPLATTAAPH